MTQPLASVSVSQSFQNLLNTVIHSLPKILTFVIVLVIGWFVAKVLQRAIVMILRRVHFDRFVERGVVGQSLARTNYDAAGLIARIAYYAIVLIALQIAFGLFGTNPVSTMLDAIVGWLPKAIVAIILIVVASAVAKMVKDLLNGFMGGLSYGRFLTAAASVLVIAIGVIAALDQIGIASDVTNPVLYAGLATTGAILAIGVGGGAVKPMQERWERILTAAERETNNQVSAYQQGRLDAVNARAGQPGGEGQPGMGGQDQAGEGQAGGEGQ